jgi:hypothetical protein
VVGASATAAAVVASVRLAAVGAAIDAAANVAYVPVPTPSAASSASSSSAAVAGRAAGSLARQRITTSANAGGTSGRTVPSGSGTRVSCAARVAWGDAAANGEAPVSSS